MVDHDVEHEAIELRLGQRVRALQLDRVLRREDVERLLQLIRASLDRDAVLLHRFEERRLGFRRRAVDLIGEHDVREDRPWRKHHLAPARRRIFLDEICSGNVRGHQVRRELNPRELQVEHARERVNEERFGEPWHADDEAVAADEERQQHLGDDVLLPDDQLAQLDEDALAPPFHALGQRKVVGRFERDRVGRETLHKASMEASSCQLPAFSYFPPASRS